MAKKDYVPPRDRDVVIKMQTTAHLDDALDFLNQPKINPQQPTQPPPTQSTSTSTATSSQGKTPPKEK
jgi:hypothetical protein